MASQVIAFLRRSRRSTDWSQDEIAELYRIEHALLQARFSLETDRGVSDEGDPWFVFCRADGEVLVHIARSDEGYLLYGLGLARPLTGRAIGDISKSFVNQIPLNIPVPRKDGPQLFVHPAAALAIIVGMIFLAHDDVALVSSDGASNDGPAGASDGESTEPVHRTVRASVLAVLGKLADGTLFDGARLETGHQEGTYLNIVCTIAAVMLGASVALDSGNQDFVPLEPDTDTSVAASDGEHAAPTSPDLTTMTDVTMRVDSPMVDPLVRAADDALALASSDDAQPAGTKLAGIVVEIAQDAARQQVPALESGALDHEKVNLTGDNTAAFDQPRHLIQGDGNSLQRAAAAANESAPETAKSAASNASPPAASPHHDDSSSTSAEDALQHLLKSAGLSDTTLAHMDHPLVHASPEILQSITAPVVATPAPVQADAKTDTRGDETKGDVAQAKLFPVFDNSAREYLTNFLRDNPNSQTYFNDQTVVVYDGQKDFADKPVTVQVWELDTGATIAIVGHIDYPLYHA